MLEALLKKAEEKGIPGGEVLLAEKGRIKEYHSYGYLSIVPEKIPWERGRFLDLASITKPLVTAFLILYFASKGELSLEDDIGKYVPELSHWKVAIIELATHSAGLPAWVPLYRGGAGRQAMLAQLASLEPSKRGQVVYSCPGYIALGLVIEKLTDSRIRDFAPEFFLEYGIEIKYGKIPEEISVPTELGNIYEREKAGQVKVKFRENLIWGEVHDGNSYYWGGDAGNAGAFAKADDLIKFPLLMDILGDYRKFATGCLVETRSFGWDTRGDVILHHGFTGGTLIINPVKQRLAFVYLNRTHPYVRFEEMEELRREFMKISLQTLKK